MNTPNLSLEDKMKGLSEAAASARRRHAKILHKPGAAFNMAFNFLLPDTYMQPHYHPSKEKVERISIVEGKIAVLYFDGEGTVTKITVLEPGKTEWLDVPAFCFHTYVVLSPRAITYETMAGIYDPATWKTFAPWAPREGTSESIIYLSSLKQRAGAS